MIQRLKKTVSVLMLGAALSTGVLTASAPQADAGIILAPVGVGFVVLYFGLVEHRAWMIVLGTQGTTTQTDLGTALAQKYPTLDSNTVNELATAITTQATSPTATTNTTTTTTTTGATTTHTAVTVTMTRDQLSTALKDTNVEFDQPGVFNQIAMDLQ
jgi:hypothetical protein